MFYLYIHLTICLASYYANWTSEWEDSKYKGTQAMPYFSKEPYGYFKYPVYSTDTWDLGLKSYPNDMVRRVIKLTIPGLTV